MSNKSVADGALADSLPWEVRGLALADEEALAVLLYFWETWVLALSFGPGTSSGQVFACDCK